MIVKIEKLTEEQALQIGRKLAESIENEGFVEYYDSFGFGNDLEVIRMDDIEAYSFLTDYLDSIDENHILLITNSKFFSIINFLDSVLNQLLHYVAVFRYHCRNINILKNLAITTCSWNSTR